MDEQSSYLNYCNDYLFGKGRIALLETGGTNLEAEIIEIDESGALLTRNEKGELITVHTGSILKFLN